MLATYSVSSKKNGHELFRTRGEASQCKHAHNVHVQLNINDILNLYPSLHIITYTLGKVKLAAV